ncbi:MAG: GIY-YIG nuclease family protein [Candidatus Nanohalobium sp.]
MNLRQKVNNLPSEKGVYCFYDLNEEPVYVGKTNSSIRSRLKQHLIRQDSSIVSYGKLDIWDIFYVKYWKVENPDRLEKELISDLEPYLNLEGFDSNFSDLERDNPTGKLNLISDKEAEFRRKPYNRTKQKLEHLERMADKIKTSNHTKDTQSILYKHLNILEDSIDDFLDTKSS